MFGLGWLRALTDARGLLEHAHHGVPRLGEGYTTDDNARALLYLSLLPEGARDEGLVRTYLAFLLHMQKEDGRFRNGLTLDGRFEDEGEAEDPTGRAVLALAAAQRLSPPYAGPAREALLRALPALEGFPSLRGRAYALLGLLALPKEPFLEAAEAGGGAPSRLPGGRARLALPRPPHLRQPPPRGGPVRLRPRLPPPRGGGPGPEGPRLPQGALLHPGGGGPLL